VIFFMGCSWVPFHPGVFHVVEAKEELPSVPKSFKAQFRVTYFNGKVSSDYRIRGWFSSPSDAPNPLLNYQAKVIVDVYSGKAESLKNFTALITKTRGRGPSFSGEQMKRVNQYVGQTTRVV